MHWRGVRSGRLGNRAPVASSGKKGRRPDALPNGSEEQCEEAAQHRADEQHRPIQRCEPEQPVVSENATHIVKVCEAVCNIAPAGDDGSSAGATASQISTNQTSFPEGVAFLHRSLEYAVQIMGGAASRRQSAMMRSRSRFSMSLAGFLCCATSPGRLWQPGLFHLGGARRWCIGRRSCCNEISRTVTDEFRE
jgi:hypothetical protein